VKTTVAVTVDVAFKSVFGRETNRHLTADLLNAVLSPPVGKQVREVTLHNPFTPADYASEKVAVYDVRASDQAGRRYNVEMQRNAPWSFDKRVVYYLAKLHGEQMQSGDYYETLCPSHAISILGDRVIDDAHFHHRFRLHDDERGVLFSKDVEVHVIELVKFDLPVEQVKTPLERWAYFLRHSAELDPEALPRELDTPFIKQALEVLVMLSQDERERSLYLDRFKAQCDEASRQYFAQNAREIGVKEGIEQGIEQGIEKGIEKGEVIGRIRLCQEMLKLPMTPREDLLRLPLEDLARQAAELRSKLRPAGNGAS